MDLDDIEPDPYDHHGQWNPHKDDRYKSVKPEGVRFTYLYDTKRAQDAWIHSDTAIALGDAR